MGFGVARSTDRAMPEPQSVGRVTGRFPRFFVSIAMNNKEPPSAGSRLDNSCYPIMFKDYYLILGVGKDATPEEIEKAYNDAETMMNKNTSSARIQDIKEAYTVLSYQEAKSMYDKELATFNWSDGFANYKIKDQNLETLINTLQGNATKSKDIVENSNQLKEEDNKPLDEEDSTDGNMSCYNSQESVHNHSIQKRINKLPINNSRGMFRRLFTPYGRIRRTEYFISLVCYLFIYFLLGIMIRIAYETDRTALLYFKLADVLFFILFVFQCIKRCHDWGHTGWFLLIPFMPIYLIFADGEDEVNKYGTNPIFDYDWQISDDNK